MMIKLLNTIESKRKSGNYIWNILVILKDFVWKIFTRVSIFRLVTKLKYGKFKSDNELINFAFNYKNSLTPIQIKSEFTSLVGCVKDINPKIIMEIGTVCGGDLFVLSRLTSKNGIIISLDLPDGEFGGGFPSWKIPIFKLFATKRQKIHFIRKDSHEMETLREIKSVLGVKKIDFLFIDADHTYGGVKKDFQMYSPLVREGGIIAFHDICNHKDLPRMEVNKFWNEIIKKYDYVEFIDDPKQEGYGIGLIKI